MLPYTDDFSDRQGTLAGFALQRFRQRDGLPPPTGIRHPDAGRRRHGARRARRRGGPDRSPAQDHQWEAGRPSAIAKPLILGGYGVAILVRPLISVASSAWQVVGFRVIDRVGKGLRTATSRRGHLRDHVPAGRGVHSGTIAPPTTSAPCWARSRHGTSSRAARTCEVSSDSVRCLGLSRSSCSPWC